MAFLITVAVVAGEEQKPYLLRFVNYDTLQPITETKVLLKPRRIILKAEPNQISGDPNLKFAKTLITDTNGVCQLSRELADSLSNKGTDYVDCSINGYPPFVLRRHKPAEYYVPYYAITLFDRTDGLMYTVILSWIEPTVLLLQPKTKQIPNKHMEGTR